jgi:hypothetical protein
VDKNLLLVGWSVGNLPLCVKEKAVSLSGGPSYLAGFGILMLFNLEMDMTTPPFGVMLFVMKGVVPPSVTIKDICYATLPFILCDMVAMIMIISSPGWPSGYQD